MLIASAVLICLNACGEDSFDESIPVNPVLVPFKSITAIDGDKIVNAEISDKNRTIHLNLVKLRNLNSVDVTLHISKRAKLLAPLDTIVNYNLTTPQEIVINNLYKDLTYTLTASIPENIEVDKSLFKEFRLDNDTPLMEGNIVFLWDGGAMTKPGNYAEVGYRNYLTGQCFTVDLGDHYHLKEFKANLYWAYTNVCPKKYELWGYEGTGEPPISGDWNDWTNLGLLDNTGETNADFADGDKLEFTKEASPLVRYIRVKCLENYRNPATSIFSLSEISFWAWNM